MPELDHFEMRIAAAVHAFADGADTRVDPMTVATETIGRRGRPSYVWRWTPLQVSAPILVLLALLLALLAWSLQVGAPRDGRTAVVPEPSTPAASTVTPAASINPARGEAVSGAGTISIVTRGTTVQVGEITQVRGFVATSIDVMGDPRASGTGTLRLSIDTHGQVGTEWGTYRLETADGAWQGSVTGGATNSGNADAIDVAGYLVGSGAYAGSTYYIHVRSSNLTSEVEGIIYPGSPPGL